MTVALELEREAQRRGYNAEFVATGQTGILIEGDGTPLDAIPGDFMSGEVERLVVERDRAGADVIFVEGQGALLHPGFGPVTLGLMLGAMPDAYVLCHQVGRETYRPGYSVPLLSLSRNIVLYEHLMQPYKSPRVACIGLNTVEVDDETARAAAEAACAETGLPAADVIRHGSAELFDALEPVIRQKLGRG
jgi:uncharacterized NAD-dependent epimerase/dehydratase family protein